MTDLDLRLPPGELVRLAECVLEPIRFPGTIQPHGALIVASRDQLRITHVSDNTGELMGAEPIALLGRHLSEVVGDDTIRAIRAILDPSEARSNPTHVTIGGTAFDVIAHDTGDAVMIDLEPVDPRADDQTSIVRTAFRRLSLATSVEELWAGTAVELRRITGFDRVMVYNFHADGHGEVVAEQVIDGLEPFLGLHYPASDIPAQARELYLRKLSRLIASSSGTSAALLADANALTAATAPAELDLSGAELRSVSPHHLQFMRNMGQASTFSLSLIRRGELVGMITCASQTERRIPFTTREALEILANQVSLQLGAMIEIDRLEHKNHVREIRSTLMSQIEADSIAGGLLDHQVNALDFIPADGVVVSLGGELRHTGSVPPPAQLREFIAQLAGRQYGLSFVSSSVPLDHPELATSIEPFAGALVRPFGADGDYIAWFRGEVALTVDWLGDMSLSNRVSTLSPRNSFSAWSEDVTGTSAPWAGLDLDAADLCRDLDSVLLHRAVSELAQLALRDVLTGLPNRRVLMDRLGLAIEQHSRLGDLAVLFIDLDGFKAINDDLGHAAGDAALVFVAETLKTVVRAEDTIARLGGDEFVILCEHTTVDDARHVAERVIDALAAAGETDPARRLSASVGIALATEQSTASQLLTASDAAMYRAKLAGRGRVSL